VIIGAANADDLVDDASCGFDRFELETAADAFQIRENRPPESEQELVDAGDLDNGLVETYDLEPGTTDAVAVAGEGCD
jgi:hypothetical protein